MVKRPTVASPTPVKRGGEDLSDSDDEEVIQYSLDETSIYRQGTYNQWCMTKHNDGSTEVVMVEAGGILVGATAKEVAPHAESTYK